MSREEVIQSFPTPTTGFTSTDFIIGTVIGTVIAVIILMLINKLNGKKATKWSKRYFIFLSIVMFAVPYTLKLSSDVAIWFQKQLIQTEWVYETFVPYVKSIDPIKVPVVQSRWNEKANLDILLDTKKYDTILKNVSDVDFYDSDDLDDKGSVYYFDAGNLDDFPKESISLIEDKAVILDRITLPNREIPNTIQKR